MRTFSSDNQHTLVLVSTVPAHMSNLKINIDPSKRENYPPQKNKDRFGEGKFREPFYVSDFLQVKELKYVPTQI